MSAYCSDLNIKFCFQEQSKFEQEFANTSVSAPVKQFPQSENIATFFVRRKLFRLKIILTL